MEELLLNNIRAGKSQVITLNDPESPIIKMIIECYKPQTDEKLLDCYISKPSDSHVWWIIRTSRRLIYQDEDKHATLMIDRTNRKPISINFNVFNKNILSFIRGLNLLVHFEVNDVSFNQSIIDMFNSSNIDSISASTDGKSMLHPDNTSSSSTTVANISSSTSSSTTASSGSTAVSKSDIYPMRALLIANMPAYSSKTYDTKDSSIMAAIKKISGIYKEEKVIACYASRPNNKDVLWITHTTHYLWWSAPDGNSETAMPLIKTNLANKRVIRKGNYLTGFDSNTELTPLNHLVDDEKFAQSIVELFATSNKWAEFKKQFEKKQKLSDELMELEPLGLKYTVPALTDHIKQIKDELTKLTIPPQILTYDEICKLA